ncbi:MAG: redoxin domain-containing protein [Nitrospirota bacterium]
MMMRFTKVTNIHTEIYARLRIFVHAVIFSVVILSIPSDSCALIGTLEGEAPHPFTLEDLTGRTVESAALFGSKPVILVFWELPISKSFIDYSMDELRFLNDFYEKHHEATGLDVIGIYTPEEDGDVPAAEIDRVRDLVKVNRIKFTILVDRGFRVFREYGVIALPSTVMVDQSGKIRFIYPSFPLAAQPVFTKTIQNLIGIAPLRTEKEPEETAGQDSHSIRLYKYALQMYKKGLPEQALSPLKKSVELGHGFSPSHNLMGIILWKRGNFEGAVEEFNTAVTLDRTYVPAHFNYGVLLFESEKFAEAERHLKETLSLNSEMAEAHYVLGLLYKKTDREADAERELGAALTLFEKRKAVSAYEIYAPSAFHRISTLFALSELFRKKGENARAMEALQKAVSLALGLDIKTERETLHRSRDLMLYE